MVNESLNVLFDVQELLRFVLACQASTTELLLTIFDELYVCPLINDYVNKSLN